VSRQLRDWKRNWVSRCSAGEIRLFQTIPLESDLRIRKSLSQRCDEFEPDFPRNNATPSFLFQVRAIAGSRGLGNAQPRRARLTFSSRDVTK